MASWISISPKLIMYSVVSMPSNRATDGLLTPPLLDPRPLFLPPSLLSPPLLPLALPPALVESVDRVPDWLESVCLDVRQPCLLPDELEAAGRT